MLDVGFLHRHSPARLLYRTFGETPVGDPAVDALPMTPPGAEQPVVPTQTGRHQATANSVATARQRSSHNRQSPATTDRWAAKPTAPTASQPGTSVASRDHEQTSNRREPTGHRQDLSAYRRDTTAHHRDSAAPGQPPNSDDTQLTSLKQSAHRRTVDQSLPTAASRHHRTAGSHSRLTEHDRSEPSGIPSQQLLHERSIAEGERSDQFTTEPRGVRDPSDPQPEPTADTAGSMYGPQLSAMARAVSDGKRMARLGVSSQLVDTEQPQQSPSRWTVRPIRTVSAETHAVSAANRQPPQNRQESPVTRVGVGSWSPTGGPQPSIVRQHSRGRPLTMLAKPDRNSTAAANRRPHQDEPELTRPPEPTPNRTRSSQQPVRSGNRIYSEGSNQIHSETSDRIYTEADDRIQPGTEGYAVGSETSGAVEPSSDQNSSTSPPALRHETADSQPTRRSRIQRVIQRQRLDNQQLIAGRQPTTATSGPRARAQTISDKTTRSRPNQSATRREQTQTAIADTEQPPKRAAPDVKQSANSAITNIGQHPNRAETLPVESPSPHTTAEPAARAGDWSDERRTGASRRSDLQRVGGKKSNNQMVARQSNSRSLSSLSAASKSAVRHQTGRPMTMRAATSAASAWPHRTRPSRSQNGKQKPAGSTRHAETVGSRHLERPAPAAGNRQPSAGGGPRLGRATPSQIQSSGSASERSAVQDNNDSRPSESRIGTRLSMDKPAGRVFAPWMTLASDDSQQPKTGTKATNRPSAGVSQPASAGSAAVRSYTTARQNVGRSQPPGNAGRENQVSNRQQYTSTRQQHVSNRQQQTVAASPNSRGSTHTHRLLTEAARKPRSQPPGSRLHRQAQASERPVRSASRQPPGTADRQSVARWPSIGQQSSTAQQSLNTPSPEILQTPTTPSPAAQRPSTAPSPSMRQQPTSQQTVTPNRSAVTPTAGADRRIHRLQRQIDTATASSRPAPTVTRSRANRKTVRPAGVSNAGPGGQATGQWKESDRPGAGDSDGTSRLMEATNQAGGLPTDQTRAGRAKHRDTVHFSPGQQRPTRPPRPLWNRTTAEQSNSAKARRATYHGRETRHDDTTTQKQGVNSRQYGTDSRQHGTESRERDDVAGEQAAEFEQSRQLRSRIEPRLATAAVASAATGEKTTPVSRSGSQDDQSGQTRASRPSGGSARLGVFTPSRSDSGPGPGSQPDSQPSSQFGSRPAGERSPRSRGKTASRRPRLTLEARPERGQSSSEADKTERSEKPRERSTTGRRGAKRGHSKNGQSTQPTDNPFGTVEQAGSQPGLSTGAGGGPFGQQAERRRPRSGSREDTASSQQRGSGPSAGSLSYDSDVDRLVETLYRRLERKLRIERERKGL